MKKTVSARSKLNKMIKKQVNESRKVNRKNDKTFKNKSALKKCNRFCRKDYVPETNRAFKRFAKEYGEPYPIPTKDEDDYTYEVCKKLYCNEHCNGFGITEETKKKDMTYGFQKSYTFEQRNKLKERGAFSGCVNDPNYDVFHK
jgi:hypothetical protein